MHKIALVTDSACDLDRETIERLGIRVLPLGVIYRDSQYQDGVDIQPEEVYARLSEEIPTTSMPTPEQAKALLEQLVHEGYTHILAIHLSSGLSGTYEMVRMISKEIRDVPIEVIDSLILSMGLGFVVRRAAHWIRDGIAFEDLIQRVRGIIGKAKGFFVLRTLEYLRRGGRIGLVQATIGEVLDLKPVISVNEHGKYFSYARVRGRAKSLERLYEVARELLSKGRSVVAVLQGDAREEALALMERIRQLPNVDELLFRPISPALVVHTGPGLVGLIVMPAE